jgi:hypothetical protein
MPVGALPLLKGDRSLRKIYLRRVLTVLRKRPDGVLLKLYAIRCATHYHFHRLTRQLRAHDGSLLKHLLTVALPRAMMAPGRAKTTRRRRYLLAEAIFLTLSRVRPVRLTPESGHRLVPRQRPLCAKNGLMQCSKQRRFIH